MQQGQSWRSAPEHTTHRHPTVSISTTLLCCSFTAELACYENQFLLLNWLFIVYGRWSFHVVLTNSIKASIRKVVTEVTSNSYWMVVE